MDLRRVHIREWVMGLVAVVLLVSLFLPWLGDTETDATATAWEWLSLVDLFLALVALAALAVVFFTAQQATPGVPMALLSLTEGATLIAAVVLAIRLLTAPDGASLEYGAWLGMAAVLGVAAAGYWAMRDEHIGAPSRAEPPEMLPAP